MRGGARYPRSPSGEAWLFSVSISRMNFSASMGVALLVEGSTAELPEHPIRVLLLRANDLGFGVRKRKSRVRYYLRASVGQPSKERLSTGSAGAHPRFCCCPARALIILTAPSSHTQWLATAAAKFSPPKGDKAFHAFDRAAICSRTCFTSSS